ncbi:MAG: hypothetical protein V4659_09530 [Pseudomonadota bacterium]
MSWGWRVDGPDGVEFVTRRPSARAGYSAPVAVDRAPGPFEDFIDGKWVVDHERAIDAAHLAAHGSDAIKLAHARKATEAAIVMAGGVVTGGLLAREATLTGQLLPALAKAVLARAEAAAASEVARIDAKRRARERKKA